MQRRVAKFESRTGVMLILIYVSICYVIFKIFKIPVNQWSLATSALGGIRHRIAAANRELQSSVHD